MKKFIVALIILGAAAGTAFILANNKEKMAAKVHNDKIEAYPVSVATVEEEPLAHTLSLVGTIAANREVAVVAETQGRVVSLAFDMGDYRGAGTVLAQVDDELKAAAFKMAEANFEKAKKDVDRFEALYKEKTATDVQLENARLAYKNAETQLVVARRQYRDTKITTPISGTITERKIEVGSMVQSGMVIANIVDISKLKVELSVPEKDAFLLKVGSQVTVSTDVYPGVAFSGTVKSISAKADAAHTYPVEISLNNNSEHPLRAGMFGRVEFTSVQRDHAVIIPREALIGSIKDPQVYVVNNRKAELRKLVVGMETGTHIEILQGLSKGETIVVNGQNNLQDNVAVTVVK